MIILQANKIERSFAGEVLFDNISLQVDERDRIALVGKNGAGKSTLLNLGRRRKSRLLGKSIKSATFLSLIWPRIAALSRPIPSTMRCSMSLTILERPRHLAADGAGDGGKNWG